MGLMAVLLYVDLFYSIEGHGPFFNSKIMTAKHKNPSNGAPAENGPDKEEEKLFDFNQAFDSDHNQESEEEEKSDVLAGMEFALSEQKEKNLRLLAEFDNYKKRTSRERYELLNSASKDVIIALLPVLDDFERAIKSENISQGENLNEGVRMIHSRLWNVMQSQGLKAMESTGEMFDPDLHEAITDISTPDPSSKGKVIDTIEKGYMLNDKIIRHAKVVVGK